MLYYMKKAFTMTIVHNSASEIGSKNLQPLTIAN